MVIYHAHIIELGLKPKLHSAGRSEVTGILARPEGTAWLADRKVVPNYKGGGQQIKQDDKNKERGRVGEIRAQLKVAGNTGILRISKRE